MRSGSGLFPNKQCFINNHNGLGLGSHGRSVAISSPFSQPQIKVFLLHMHSKLATKPCKDKALFCVRSTKNTTVQSIAHSCKKTVVDFVLADVNQNAWNNTFILRLTYGLIWFCLCQEKRFLHSQNRILSPLHRFTCAGLMGRSGHKNIVPSQALHTRVCTWTPLHMLLCYKSFITEKKKECDS